MDDSSPQTTLEEPVAQAAPQMLDTEQTIQEPVLQEASAVPPEVSEAPLQEQESGEAPTYQISDTELENITGPPCRN